MLEPTTGLKRGRGFLVESIAWCQQLARGVAPGLSVSVTQSTKPRQKPKTAGLVAPFQPTFLTVIL